LPACGFCGFVALGSVEDGVVEGGVAGLVDGVGGGVMVDGDDCEDEPMVSGLAADGDAPASSLRGEEVPLIADASSVTWRRTSRSLSLAASSSVVAFARARPVVPVAWVSVPVGGVAGAEPVSGPIRSVRILSMAATSVPHFDAAEAEALFDELFAPAGAEVLDEAFTSRSRLFRCVRSCANFVRSDAGIALCGMLLSASLACRTCSAGVAAVSGFWDDAEAEGGWLWELVGCGGDELDGGWAKPTAGSAINAAAANAVAQRAVERVICDSS
jgi:hypothetical protein